MAHIILISIIVLILIIGTILVRKAWKTEKDKQKWAKTIKLGDKCRYYFVSGTTPDEMWVSKKREDGKYEITFIGQERFLYPQK